MSPYYVNWSAHPGHAWNVLASRCPKCHYAMSRIVWGRR